MLHLGGRERKGQRGCYLSRIGGRERQRRKSWDRGEDGGVVGGAEGAEATGAPAVAIDGALDC